MRWLGIGAAVFLAIGYIYDERQSDGVRELRAPLPVTVAPAENAYFALLGHGAEPGKDPHAAGMEYARLLEAAVAQNPEAAETPRDELLGPPGLEVVDEAGLMEDACDFPAILDLTVEKEAEVVALLAANEELLVRYRRLLDYPHFQETMPLPYRAEILHHSGSRLYLLDAALRLRAGKTAEATAMLGRNLVFWRMVLGEGRHLLASMVASGRINRTLETLAWAVGKELVIADDDPSLEKALAPLTPRERDLTEPVLRSHASALEEIARDLEAIPWYLPARLIVKPNATLNYYYGLVEKDRPLFSQTTREYMARRGDQVRAPLGHGPLAEKGTEGRQEWFNFVGKSLADISYMNLGGFVERVHAVDGRLALARLQLSLAGRGDGADVEAALAAACPPDCNPFTGEAASWDPAEEALFFMVPGGKEPRRIDVHLPRPRPAAPP